MFPKVERDEDILMLSGREFCSSVAGGMKIRNFDVEGMIMTRMEYELMKN